MSASHDKILKLLNMTVKNGCTEDEQETALKMAMAIAAREGIDLEALRPKDAPKIKAVMKGHYQEFKPHQALAAQAAAVLFGVECNVYNLGARGFNFVGRPELIELAEETMFWLFRQIEELYKQALPKGLSKTERAEFRKTFKAACALRTWERAREAMRDMRYNDARAQEATGHNALVVQGYFETLEKEQDEFWEERFAETPEQKARREAQEKAQAEWDAAHPKEAARRKKEEERAAAKAARQAAKRKGRRERSIPMGSGTNLGYAAGDAVQLRKEVK